MVMLVLSRKCGEAISIGGGITVKVIEIRGSRVKLGFECPPDVRILRAEILNEFHRMTVPQVRETAELVAT
jgi:carbon storage regulator